MNLPLLSKATSPSPWSTKLPTVPRNHAKNFLFWICPDPTFLMPHPGFPKHEFPKLWARPFLSWLFLHFLPHLDLVTWALGSLLPDWLGNLLRCSPQNHPQAPQGIASTQRPPQAKVQNSQWSKQRKGCQNIQCSFKSTCKHQLPSTTEHYQSEIYSREWRNVVKKRWGVSIGIFLCLLSLVFATTAYCLRHRFWNQLPGFKFWFCYSLNHFGQATYPPRVPLSSSVK